MNVISNVSLWKDKSFLFEREVCNLLHLDQNDFDTIVQKNKGYALLLRNWIAEAYQAGITAEEVSVMIKNSKFYNKSSLTFYT